jgi:leucyl aminopeptidase
MKLLKEKYQNLTVQAVFAEEDSAPVNQLKERGLFDGKENSMYAILDEEGYGTIYYGLGKEEDLTSYQTTVYFHSLAKYLQNAKFTQVHLKLPATIAEDSDLLAKVFEGLYQAEYQFNDYKKEPQELEELQISLDDIEQAEEIFTSVEHVIEGIFHARDLVNQPANVIYPETLAEKVQEIFAGSEVAVEVYNQEEIEELGMEAYLAVNKGSDREPRLIVLKYMPTEATDHVSLVGKGMTYDSGGYAIKSAGGMKTMKSDMAGAASVIGAIYALAQNEVQQNVVGIVAAAENMIDGKAFKNGDIISSMKGTSIEVNNTDAEGRLTLADAIYYAASELSSSAIVDVATLTGAAISALGPQTTAMISNNDDVADKVIEASEKASEPTHRLPAFPSHYKKIKGQFADLDNAPTGGGGAITAGLFLEHFAEDTPWVHLDIAGPSYSAKGYDYLPAGASGTGVKTLYHWVSQL